MCSFLAGINTGNIQVIRSVAASTSLDVHPDSSIWKFSFMFMIEASIKGAGQFMFVDTTLGGVFVILGIAVASRRGNLISKQIVGISFEPYFFLFLFCFLFLFFLHFFFSPVPSPLMNRCICSVVRKCHGGHYRILFAASASK